MPISSLTQHRATLTMSGQDVDATSPSRSRSTGTSRWGMPSTRYSSSPSCSPWFGDLIPTLSSLRRASMPPKAMACRSLRWSATTSCHLHGMATWFRYAKDLHNHIINKFLQDLMPFANGKIVLTLEGGYTPEKIAACATQVAKAILGKPLETLKWVWLEYLNLLISFDIYYWHNLLLKLGWGR